MKAAAGIQPRGSKARRLLPEYKQFLEINGDFVVSDPRCKPGYSWPACSVGQVAVPEGAQTVRVIFAGGSGTLDGLPEQAPALPTRACLRVIGIEGLGSHDVYIGREHRARTGRLLAASQWANPYKVRDCMDVLDCVQRFDSHLRASPHLLAQLPDLAGRALICHCPVSAPCHADAIIAAFREFCMAASTGATLLVGVFRTPAEFATAAAACSHPFEDFVLAPAVVDMLKFRMSTSTADIIAYRVAVIRHWSARADALAAREEELHGALHPDVRGVMAGKRILVFSEMPAELAFPSRSALVHGLCAGFPVVGDFPRTEIFPAADRRASYAAGRRSRVFVAPWSLSSGRN